jgi:hypothetical protein
VVLYAHEISRIAGQSRSSRRDTRHAAFLTPSSEASSRATRSETLQSRSRLHPEHLRVLTAFGAPTHPFHVGFTRDLADPPAQRLFLGFRKPRQTGSTETSSRVVVEVQDFDGGFLHEASVARGGLGRDAIVGRCESCGSRWWLTERLAGSSAVREWWSVLGQVGGIQSEVTRHTIR